MNETAISLKLWVVMNRAFRAIEEHLRRQVSAHGIGFTEFGVLEVLLHKGRLPIGEIGNRVLLTSGSMTYVIDKLEKRGFIRRAACSEDRRVLYAELTPEGQAFIEAVFAEHAALLCNLLQGIHPHEQETATDLIKRMGLFAQNYTPAESAA
jgi:MarR family 2-MHQ and catechol resistance regulon transcriptional repressor